MHIRFRPNASINARSSRIDAGPEPYASARQAVAGHRLPAARYCIRVRFLNRLVPTWLMRGRTHVP